MISSPKASVSSYNRGHNISRLPGLSLGFRKKTCMKQEGHPPSGTRQGGTRYPVLRAQQAAVSLTHQGVTGLERLVRSTAISEHEDGQRMNRKGEAAIPGRSPPGKP